ncbi:response regulator [Stakelama sediminis]|uniref:Two-component system KDP operon response regulator KdpE n=1 Tax=Stakelama sediminis TaxID=463200 RepID=A0A840Z1T6_9SPHN|nr:response regulator transcription factor [Stakelama sediminis]MBB5719704.1 two-component system KDP operon response regulator KdpE [Stakelama sediminis]
MSSVLVVDDELAIRRLVASILSRGGHEAIPAGTAAEALTLIERRPPDAAIVDLGLPDRDGLELVAALRAAGDLPILVLSARSDTTDKIAALDLGADDYVTKPFDGDELLARLRSALRRSGSAVPADPVLRHGVLTLDPDRREVTVRGEAAMLTPREFSVLHLLVAAGGRVLTHRHILETVWGPAHIGDTEYLRVIVRSLRLKLEEDPTRPQLIRNEPAIGYRLV